MVSRLLLVYAVVELAAIFALVWTIGWGWTLLILLVTFVLGWGLLAPMAGSQLIQQLGRLRSGLKEPRSTLGDGALVTVATGLVLVPGLVTTVVRAVAAAAAGARRRRPGIDRDRAARSAAAGAAGHLHGALSPNPVAAIRRDGRDYIDGEVIDVHGVRPACLAERIQSATSPRVGRARELIALGAAPR